MMIWNRKNLVPLLSFSSCTNYVVGYRIGGGIHNCPSDLPIKSQYLYLCTVCYSEWLALVPFLSSFLSYSHPLIHLTLLPLLLGIHIYFHSPFSHLHTSILFYSCWTSFLKLLGFLPTHSLLSLQMTMSSSNIAVNGASCLTSSVNTDATTPLAGTHVSLRQHT